MTREELIQQLEGRGLIPDVFYALIPAILTELRRVGRLEENVNHCAENHDWAAWNKTLNERMDRIKALEGALKSIADDDENVNCNMNHPYQAKQALSPSEGNGKEG